MKRSGPVPIDVLSGKLLMEFNPFMTDASGNLKVENMVVHPKLNLMGQALLPSSSYRSQSKLGEQE